MTNRTNSSQWWTFFESIDKFNAKCKICTKIVKTGGGTSNIKSHMKTNHFTVYYEKENANSASKHSDQNVDYSSIDEDSDSQHSLASPARPSPSPSPTLSIDCPQSPQSLNSLLSTVPESSCSYSTTKQKMSAGKQQQSCLDLFKAPDSKSALKLHMSVAYFICTSNKPLNLVEDESFRLMLRCFRPGYEVCGRKALTDNYLVKLYNSTKKFIQCALRDADYVTLTTDAWTSNAGNPYMTLTIHFINQEWRLQSYTLCCKQLNVDHTGVNIKDWILETLQEWEIDIKMVLSFTVDNGENIRLAADLLGVLVVRCLGHTLQNGVDDIAKLPEIVQLKKRTHALQHLFSSSKVKNKYGTFINDLYQKKPKTLPGLSPTRWWSELPLNRVLIEDVNYHREFLAHYENGSNMHLLLDETQMALLKTCSATLDPLEELTSAMSGENYVTASAIIPVVYLIEKTIVDLQSRITESTTNGDSTTASASNSRFDSAKGTEQTVQPDIEFLKLIMRKLYKRYSPDSLGSGELGLQVRQTRVDVRSGKSCHDLLIKTTFLDPRFKHELKEKDIISAKSQLSHDLGDKLPAQVTSGSNQSPPSKKQKAGLASVFAKLSGNREQIVTETLDQKFEKELHRYEAHPSVSIDDDVLIWWKERDASFPLLASLARKYLAITATSTPSERVFSTGGQVISDQRTCLTGEHADQLIFLSMNKKFVPKPK